jgi:glycosyltransferase involved in cell wall biosynthesis
MKICFLMYQGNMFSGGQGIYLYYLTRELIRLGHEVHVIAGPPYPTLAEGVVAHNLETYSFYSYHHYRHNFLFQRHPITYFHPVNLYEFVSTRVALSSLLLMFSLRAYVKLAELSRHHHFDVIHDNQTLSYGITMMQAAGYPVTATVHHPLSVDMRNSVAQSRSLYERARRLLWFPWIMQEVVARRLERIITVSQASAGAVSRAFRIPSQRIHVVHNGIDSDTFRPLPGVEREPGHILYVGNTEDRNKGGRYLFEALRLLRDDVKFHLTLVDQKKYNLKLAPRLVRQYDLHSRVTFAGRVSTEQLVHLYNRAQIVVSPSLYEGFGLPAAEAMACEAPVIATTAPAFPEVIDHGQTGWLVPPASAQALADAIKMLMADPGLCARLGKAGRQAIRQRFQWRRAAQETLDVYERLLGRKGPTAEQMVIPEALRAEGS